MIHIELVQQKTGFTFKVIGVTPNPIYGSGDNEKKALLAALRKLSGDLNFRVSVYLDGDSDHNWNFYPADKYRQD